VTRSEQIEQALRDLVAQHHAVQSPSRGGPQVLWGMNPANVTLSRSELIRNAERALLRPEDSL
jgi:metal-responsive CopG/Arc/MetJ family transcriptional regulator